MNDIDKNLIEKLKLLSTTISNVDIQTTKWHGEVMKMIDDITSAISSHQLCIVRILNTLVEQEKAIVRLLTRDSIKSPDFIQHVPSTKDKKPN